MDWCLVRSSIHKQHWGGWGDVPPNSSGNKDHLDQLNQSLKGILENIIMPHLKEWSGNNGYGKSLVHLAENCLLCLAMTIQQSSFPPPAGYLTFYWKLAQIELYNLLHAKPAHFRYWSMESHPLLCSLLPLSCGFPQKTQNVFWRWINNF